MLRIVVFGGGRWARNLVGTVARLLPAGAEVLWVTSHLLPTARAWLAEQNDLANVAVVPEIDWQTLDAAGAIVATSPETHYAIARQAIVQRIPTLCEKPIASSLQQAKELIDLAASMNCPLGIHLEFLYASYLHQFAESVRSSTCRTVDIRWLDPQVEQRQGESKFAELFVDIANDQLPHCWSILRMLLPGGLQIDSLETTERSILVFGTMGSAAVRCELSRYAEERTRRVSINDGEWALDFSNEPGFLHRLGEVQALAWSGLRPLASSLGDFLNVVQGKISADDWRLATCHTGDAMRASMRAAEMLHKVQDQQIEALALCGFVGIEDPACLRLICDRFLPELAQQGLRFAARDDQQRLEFVRFWLRRRSSPPAPLANEKSTDGGTRE